MNTTTLISLSPDELSARLAEAVRPLVNQIARLQAEGSRPDLLTISEIAKRTGYSTDIVRGWISAGRTVPGTRRKVKLKVVEGLDTGRVYRIRWEAYVEFLASFPDITL